MARSTPPCFVQEPAAPRSAWAPNIAMAIHGGLVHPTTAISRTAGWVGGPPLKSFSSAEATAEQYPPVPGCDHGRSEGVVPQRRRLAYGAGIIAILIGATLVYVLFPRKDAEQRLLMEYHAADTRAVTKEACDE
jgi:hypothetical protein